MGYPHHQPYQEFQSHDNNPPIYQPYYSSHYTSFPSHPYQTYPPKTGAQLPTWSNEDWQPQNTHYPQNQTFPDQDKYQPQPQQSSGPPLDENHYANSTAGEIERLTVSQQNVQHCLKPDDKLVLEMQRTYEEQESNVDNMIRQVALLAAIMKEIQENRARPEVNESREEEEGESEAEETYNAEKRSGALPEEQKETKTVEIESVEKVALVEEESITTPPEDETPQKILEEANDEPR